MHDFRILFYMVLGTAVIVFLLCCLIGICRFIHDKKTGDKTFTGTFPYFLLSCTCIILVGISAVTNFGWIRFIFGIPMFLHAIVLFIITSISSRFASSSPSLKHMIYVTYLTYLMSNIFMPDGGDTGPLYVFFGLVHGGSIADVCYAVSILSFVCNVILFIMQFVLSCILYTKTKRSRNIKRVDIPAHVRDIHNAKSEGSPTDNSPYSV